MNIRFLVYIGLSFVLAGCGTVQTGTHGTYLPTPSNGYRGLIGWVTTGPQYKEMTDNCANYGGLKNWEQARGWERGGGPTIGVMYQRYECRGPINPPDLRRADVVPTPSQPQYQNASPATNSSTIDSASAKCAELGFKKGTEKFGDCVLKISK
jgi:hypothetical protein